MPETPGNLLRTLLNDAPLRCLIEAHDALSARIVGEAGGAGIWASSLTISASHGVPDDNSLSSTEALATLERMASATNLPILFDADQGYGDRCHSVRLTHALERRGIAGMCVEDKRFPKLNSFVRSESQALEDIGVFCDKLRAVKDAQRNASFVLVARTEALVTGLPLSIALERAERYVDAGADAVLVHSKAQSFGEAQGFMAQFSRRRPVILVPTTYYATPLAAFEAAGVSLIIWANHLQRAAISGMQKVARSIVHTGSGRDVEDQIVSVSELLRLGGTDVEAAGERDPRQTARAIILAASRGNGLDALTQDRPKAMIPVAGEPVVERLIRQLRAEGVRDLTVVRGYCAQACAPSGVRSVDNPRHAETGEVVSLAAALDAIQDDVVVAYGDLVVKQHLLHMLRASPAPITLLVDERHPFLRGANTEGPRDRVRASAAAPRLLDEAPRSLVHMGPDVLDGDVHGVWTGLVQLRNEGARVFRNAVESVLSEPFGERAELSAVLNRVAREHSDWVRILFVSGGWMDINGLLDLAQSHAELTP